MLSLAVQVRSQLVVAVVARPVFRQRLDFRVNN